MPEAATFQRWFTGAIISKRAPADVPAAFAVYRNTWLKALLDALDANYPTVAMILGADLFEAAALEFAREHPATTPVLALYGADFPEFLAGHPDVRDIPYLRDVAALERLWTECFFAPDAPALEPQDYVGLSPVQLLKLDPHMHPATRFARFETPAVTIWQAHRTQGEFEEIEPQWQPERALVTRHGAGVAVTPIDEGALAILGMVGSGHSLGLALADVAKRHPASDLPGALATIISSGALAVPQAEEVGIW